jgi:hypothetical protein
MARKSQFAGMATLNGRRFITQQLQSLLSQTALPFKIVICDDGSSRYAICRQVRVCGQASMLFLRARPAAWPCPMTRSATIRFSLAFSSSICHPSRTALVPHTCYANCKRRVADPCLPADLGDWRPFFCLPQNESDLYLRKLRCLRETLLIPQGGS